MLILIALIFNPLPVARAILLDHFPQYSSLKIISVTYLTQSISWILYKQIGSVDSQYIVIFICLVLLLNIFLVNVLFRNSKKIR